MVDSTGLELTPLSLATWVADKKTLTPKTEVELKADLNQAPRLQEAWAATYRLIKEYSNDEALDLLRNKIEEIKPKPEQISWSLVGIGALDEAALKIVEQSQNLPNDQRLEKLKKAVEILSTTDRIKTVVDGYCEFKYGMKGMDVMRNFITEISS